jgi:MEMO1 family protein
VLRLPAVAGRFYPSDPVELTTLVRRCANKADVTPLEQVKACLVPHAGYVYSGRVAGTVFSRIVLPRKIVILGVRHFPRGEQAAIFSRGAWRTPLGDAEVDESLAKVLLRECGLLREDSIAHSAEHSLEVQLPFLQVLVPGFTFVPVALGTVRFEDLVLVGQGIARALTSRSEDVLLLTTSDLNHYEDDATTRVKDGKAIEQLLALNACGLYDTCRREEISMCGLGPAVAMLTTLQSLGAKKAELVTYATSADVSGDVQTVVGYAGMTFS